MSLYKRVVLFFALLPFTGCGDVMTNYYRSVSTTAIAAGACRDTLSAAHEKKTAAVIEKAKTDKPGADADLNAWLPVYEKVKTACVSLKVGSRLALDAAPVVEAAVSKKKDALGWIARLAQLGFDAAKTLTDAGLAFPGVQ